MELFVLWAALASAATSLILGFLWFGALFSKAWVALVGWGDLSDDELDAIRKKGWIGMVTSLVTTGIAGGLIAALFDWMHNHDSSFPIVGSGAILGAMVFAAGGLPALMTNDRYELRPMALTVLNGLFWFFVTVLAGVYGALFGAH